ncbi:MAG: flavodoxin family protein [Bacteroidales bacterium]|nr:flavodoxin family protein [Bacteroidales bacterium]
MNVLLINGSPHPNGCTRTALNIVAATLQENGIDTEIMNIGHRNIRGCLACGRCQELGRCVFDDDPVNEAARRLEQADGLVIGSPVHYASASGAITSFLDRLFFSTPFSKRMKVGASIASARRAGTTATLDQLNKYFTICEMPIVSSRYWPMVHGHTPDDVMQDHEGVQIMRILGRNMAFLIKAIASERDRNGLPQQEETVYTNFIR